MADKISDDEEDIPDDFFDELKDNKFLDELLENVEPEIENKEPSMDDSRSSSPLVEQCLKEIDKITKDIQRKRRKIENELKEKGISRSKSRTRSPVKSTRSSVRDGGPRSRQRSRSPERRFGRNGRTRSKSPSASRRTRQTSFSRNRRRSRSRSRSRSPRRRYADRRKSPPARSTTKALTFLEELNLKFAKEGKSFPEKDLLLQQKAAEANSMKPYNKGQQGPHKPQQQQHQQQLQQQQNQPSQNFSQIAPPIHHHHQQQQPQPNATNQMYPYYVMNPMAYVQPLQPQQQYNAGFIAPEPMPQPPSTVPMYMNRMPQNNMESDAMYMNPMADGLPTNNPLGGFQSPPDMTRNQVLSRCHEAIKLLRSEENKVPKLQFLMTRTSIPDAGIIEDFASMYNSNNVEFEQTSKTGDSHNPMAVVHGKTKSLIKVLGLDSQTVYSQMELNKKLNNISDGSEFCSHTKEPIKEERPEMKIIETQTDDFNCFQCELRSAIEYSEVGTQASGPNKVSIRTQTLADGDYRGPLLRTLNKLTAGQLLAMSDFARLIIIDGPKNAEEMFQLRERLYEVYNLSQRDADTVRQAEQKRRTDGGGERSMSSFSDTRSDNPSTHSMIMNCDNASTWNNGQQQQQQQQQKWSQQGNNNGSGNVWNQSNDGGQFWNQQQQQPTWNNGPEDNTMNQSIMSQMIADRGREMIERQRQLERIEEQRLQQLQYERDIREFEAARIREQLQQQQQQQQQQHCLFNTNEPLSVHHRLGDNYVGGGGGGAGVGRGGGRGNRYRKYL